MRGSGNLEKAPPRATIKARSRASHKLDLWGGRSSAPPASDLGSVGWVRAGEFETTLSTASMSEHAFQIRASSGHSTIGRYEEEHPRRGPGGHTTGVSRVRSKGSCDTDVARNGLQLK